ncbi:MAG: hypothetical protein HKP56_15115 [Anderseniella sp.]|nr:hypothetical protein [Anderseniella sp.]
MATSDHIRPIGLITALAQEYSVVSGTVAPVRDRLIAVQSGLGRAAGFLAAAELGRLEKRLSGLVSIGFCGALDTAISTGSIILPNAIITEEDERFDTDTAWISAVAGKMAGLPVVTDRAVYCATEIIETQDGKQATHSQCGACAVDMESAGIAHAATRFNIPFIAIRIVLDEGTDTLPEATRDAVHSDGNLNIRGLLRGLASRPQDVGGLIRLAGKSSKAQKQLKVVCEALLPDFGITS